MNVSIGQIYIKPGVKFPFSHLMQIRVSDELSALVEMSPEFQSRYGPDYSFIVNVSADTGIVDNLIKGPAVFKRTRDVEYTVFLPYDVIIMAGDGCREAMRFLMAGIRSALKRARLDTTRLDERENAIIESICSDATMLSEPWPKRESPSSM
jgi:hypothetical protein